MRLCILDNDLLDGELATRYTSFGAMFIHLLDSVGATWTYEIFTTQLGQYPASFDAYDAVLLTGSGADSFSDEAWVVELRKQVTHLVQSRKKMIGVCFGHQLIALCMGAPVGRAPQGWGAGRMTYNWHRPDLPHCAQRTQIALLASHQDQVFALPPGATLVASSAFCPVAAFTVGQDIFCIQAHPEFDEAFSAHLLDEQREVLGPDQFSSTRASLQLGHEGQHIARLMVSFVESL